MVNGIDVSDFQPSVSWPTVHQAGYSFAYTVEGGFQKVMGTVRQDGVVTVTSRTTGSDGGVSFSFPPTSSPRN